MRLALDFIHEHELGPFRYKEAQRGGVKILLLGLCKFE
jgi:hypothetical protein